MSRVWLTVPHHRADSEVRLRPGGGLSDGRPGAPCLPLPSAFTCRSARVLTAAHDSSDADRGIDGVRSQGQHPDGTWAACSLLTCILRIKRQLSLLPEGI